MYQIYFNIFQLIYLKIFKYIHYYFRFPYFIHFYNFNKKLIYLIQ